MPHSNYIAENYIDSDDSDDILETLPPEQVPTGKNPKSQESRKNVTARSINLKEHRKLSVKIADIEAEIRSYENDVTQLQHRIAARKQDKETYLGKLRQVTRFLNGNSKEQEHEVGIDYEKGDFDWSEGLKSRMRDVFSIHDFRLCQRGVCNANMDGRDIVCVMPTGGGKSLTYQLPALITPGCTLVISPLISLITDQIIHLRDAGIEAVMITGGTSKEEKNEIRRRLSLLADRKLSPQDKEIKLCYVTPERLAKDNTFLALLQRLDAGHKLARVVIDEAHCVSHLGHDFRPDYQKLFRLRQLFPRVPIMALSATCPPQVLADLIKTLSLKEVVPGNNAGAEGTVYFSSPLYRKNLHYHVLPKPSKATDVLLAMKEHILQNHPNDSGIVYCFSRKDTQIVAQQLNELSGGKIRTGVYHAEIPDGEKERLHMAWHRGVIKVVCATIAFGLGIDKGDVRFVLHHSISKSLEGYYQESGRAGRDGKDSDCVLYYRPQDGTTISSQTCTDKDGPRKLHAMLDFAEDLNGCRKLKFAEYFSHSSALSIASWTTENESVLEPCGHCDNCTRPPETIERQDVTLEAWQILKILTAVQKSGDNLTLKMLATLCRSKSCEDSPPRIKGMKKDSKSREKIKLNIEALVGGRVNLSTVNLEHLLVQLLTLGYLKEEFQQTSYSRLVYVVPGHLSARLIYCTREGLRAPGRPKIECTFRRIPPKTKPASKRKLVNGTETGSPTSKRRKMVQSEKPQEQEDDLNSGSEKLYVSDSEIGFNSENVASSNTKGKAKAESLVDSDQDSDIIGYDWSHSLRDDPPMKRHHRVLRSTTLMENETEVLVLSSD